MKLAKHLLSLGLMTSFTLFGAEAPQPKIEISPEMLYEIIAQVSDVINPQNPDVESILANLLNEPLIATPSQLKKTYSDEIFTEFSLQFNTIKPSTFYIWVLMSEAGQMIHLYPFKTDEKGAIPSHTEKMCEMQTVRIEQVGKGEHLASVLFDVFNNTVFLDTLTPFPLTYPIGETGQLSLSTKLPYPVLHVEGEGLLPGEKITLTFKEKTEELTANRHGKIAQDLFIDEVLSEEPVEFKLTTAAGEQTLLLGKTDYETKYKVKIVL